MIWVLAAWVYTFLKMYWIISLEMIHFTSIKKWVLTYVGSWQPSFRVLVKGETLIGSIWGDDEVPFLYCPQWAKVLKITITGCNWLICECKPRNFLQMCVWKCGNGCNVNHSDQNTDLWRRKENMNLGNGIFLIFGERKESIKLIRNSQSEA